MREWDARADLHLDDLLPAAACAPAARADAEWGHARLLMPCALSVAVSLALSAHAAAPAADAGADNAADAWADIGASDDFSSAATLSFNESLLQFPVDVSLFTQGNPLPAGTYRVDLVLNGEWKGRNTVRFDMPPGETRVALPCFNLPLLELIGVDLMQLSSRIRLMLQRGDLLCRPLGELVEGASARYDDSQLKLELSIPQIMLRREARGAIDPSLWDNGVTAGFVDYSYNGYYRHSATAAASSNASHYLGLRSGLNVGAWRLRHQASARRDGYSGFHYRGHSAQLERALPGLRAHLTLGDTVSDGRAFDSARFQGVRIDSDERMLPDSQRGFAPIVRGIANSNAMVSITQLGQEIYQTNVPPGPFVIDDLYPTGIGGDLTVTITEADGSQHQFTIAYAGTAELVRPGRVHYTAAAGQYDNPALSNKPLFAMAHARRGFSNQMTASAGMLVTEGYHALSGGLALNLPVGALAADVAFATTRTKARRERGSSARVTWAKVIPGVRTNINIASYRHSSEGYHDLNQALQLRERERLPLPPGVTPPPPALKSRHRLIVNASQPLPQGWGQISVSASGQDYWNRDGRDTQYQLSWGRQIRRLSLGLAASRTHNVFYNRWENQYMLNLSMPLGGPAGLYAHSTLTRRDNGQALNASVSGSAGAQKQLGFGVFVSADDPNQGTRHYSGGASASWNAPKAQMSVNLSTNNSGNRQYGVSVNGGVVAFGGGLILTPRLSDTIAIVEAKHAGGALATGQGGNIRLNRRGHAVVSNLRPYRHNRVTLDPKGLSTDVAIAYTSRQIAPTAGAIALLKYETERGYSLLLQGRQSNGTPLPFAAAVYDQHGHNVGHISQGGQALLRVNQPQGTLQVRWGQGEAQRCQLNYSLPEPPRRPARQRNASVHHYRPVNATCLNQAVATLDWE